MGGQRTEKPERLVPELGPVIAMREAADRAVFDIGGYQGVADRLHTSAEFLRKLRGSRRRSDLVELVTLIGRARAVDSKREAVQKAAVFPQRGLLPLEQAALAHRARRAREEVAEEIVASNWRAVVKHGISSLAARLEVPEGRLRERLERPDRELFELIEAAGL